MTPIPAFGLHDQDPSTPASAATFEAMHAAAGAYADSLIAKGLPPGAMAGPIVISKAVTGTEDQADRINEEMWSLSANGGGTLMLAPPVTGSYRLKKVTPVTHLGAAVPGDTPGQVTCALSIPSNVTLGTLSADTKTAQFNCDTSEWPPYAFAACVMKKATGGSGISLAPNLLNLQFSTVAAFPEEWKYLATPPTAPRAIFCDNGRISCIWTSGKWRAGQYIFGDHFVTDFCELGGYAGVEYGPGETAGDNVWMFGRIQGRFCGMLFTNQGPGISGDSLIRTHMGSNAGGPCFYSYAATVGSTFVDGLDLHRVSFEGSARGIFVDPARTTLVTGINFDSCMTASVLDVSGNPPDVNRESLPAGGLIEASKVSNLQVIGGSTPFDAVGFDPTRGCLISAPGFVRDCDLGNLTVAIEVADNYGVPLIRSADVRNVTGIATTLNREETVDVEIVKTATAVQKGDLVRREGPNEGRLFDSPGKPTFGPAFAAASAGSYAAVVTDGPIRATAARLGRGVGAASVVFPVPAATAKGTVATKMSLGAGGAIPRTMQSGELSPTSVPITAVGDLSTGGGQVSINGVVYTYTSITTSGTTGLASLNGLSPALSNAAAGYGVGYVIELTETATTLGFLSGGGVAKVGSQFFTYQKASGKYLIGVSNGTGSVEVGATVEAVNVVKMTGQVLSGYPTTFGSAMIRNLTNATIRYFKYESVLADRLTSRTNATSTYLAGISAELGGSGTLAQPTRITGGTRANGKVTNLAAVASLVVRSTKGFPSAGSLRINGSLTVNYKSKTATEFKELEAGSTGEVPDDAIVTLKLGARIPAGSFVRPGVDTTHTSEDDYGTLTAAAAHMDPLGDRVGWANAQDEGGTVIVDVGA